MNTNMTRAELIEEFREERRRYHLAVNNPLYRHMTGYRHVYRYADAWDHASGWLDEFDPAREVIAEAELAREAGL